MSRDREKELASEAAVAKVQDGMVVGLGTGSTAAFALKALGRRIAQGLRIRAVPSSQWAETFARQVGIPLLTFADVNRLDVTIDGTDEFDPGLALIKGGGGALFREKIVAAASDRLWIVADGSKRVPVLGKFPLPVEVNPFGWQVAARRIGELGAEVRLRQLGISGSPGGADASGGGKRQPFVSDNGGYILDCAFGAIPDPAGLEAKLRRIVGVFETGLFVGLAETVFLAEGETVRELKR
jgi:ribose 5-phosphate isomerase A